MSAVVDDVVPSYATATMAKILVIDSCESVARDRCALLAKHDIRANTQRAALVQSP